MTRGSAWAYGALGLPLAFASLPIYVHVPRYYAETVGLELAVEGAQNVLPLHFARLHGVQLLLDVGSEVNVDDLREVSDQVVVDDQPECGRYECLLLHPDVLALAQSVDGGGVGTRPSHAVLLERAHQCCLGVAWWRLGEVLLGPYLDEFERLALLKLAKNLSLGLVAILRQDGLPTVENQY